MKLEVSTHPDSFTRLIVIKYRLDEKLDWDYIFERIRKETEV